MSNKFNVEALDNYVKVAGGDSSLSFSRELLDELAYTKKELIHILGGRTSISKNVTIKKDTEECLKEAISYLEEKKAFETFLDTVFYNDKLDIDSKNAFARLYSKTNMLCNEFFLSNKIPCDVKLQSEYGKKISLRKGQKLTKVIQSIYKNSEKAKIFLDILSKGIDIKTNKLDTQKIVVSCEPIDYLTMSVNKSNWSSCYGGMYASSTFAPMSSDNTLVAYLTKGDTKEYYADSIGGNSTSNDKFYYNSKNWRVMVFVDEVNETVTLGKQYPYKSKENLMAVLELLKEKSPFFKYLDINQEQETPNVAFNGDYAYNDFDFYRNYEEFITYANEGESSGAYNDEVIEVGFESQECLCCKNKMYPQISINLICSKCNDNYELSREEKEEW